MRALRRAGPLAAGIIALGLAGCFLEERLELSGGATVVNSTDRSVDVYVDMVAEGEVFLATLDPNETTTYGSSTACTPFALVARRGGNEVARIAPGQLCPESGWEIHDD